MFTGIVRELGEIVSLDAGAGSTHLRVSAPATATEAALGDSVALNGVCLTVVETGDVIGFDAVPETLARTSLGALAAGSVVNVEPALRAGDPLGGHIVQGHVDALGDVVAFAPEGDGRRLAIRVPPEVGRYCVHKGSLTVDGVSLTIAACNGDRVEIALIPHTLAVTTLGRLAPGDRVNLEADVVAKYVERLAAPYAAG